MPISVPEICEQMLPSTVYPQLSLSLVNMVPFIPGVVKLMTNTEPIDIGEGSKRFTVLTSKRFSALVYDMSEQDNSEIQLTFDPNAICIFLDDLYQRCHQQPQAQQLIAEVKARQARKTNDAKLQGQFTLQSLTTSWNVNPSPDPLNSPPIVEAVSDQHLAREYLLNHIITQVHQGSELAAIFSTTVAAVRPLLQADRLIIYPLAALSSVLTYDDDPPELPSPSKEAVIYEAKASPGISSVLHCQEQLGGASFTDCPHQYQRGQTLMISDLQQQCPIAKDSLEFLNSIQVKALLITPILVKSELWGLLMVHQCWRPRLWQAYEQDLLTKVGEHLAIAIHQSQLHDQVQQQQQTLEKQVAERTQELHSALIAAQSANQAKTDFLATMSHELRTPLTCVIGMSATLLRWSLGPLTDKQRSCLQTIHDSGEHLLDLINDILDFSHVQSGKATLNVSEFSLSSLIQQVLQMMRDKANAHEVQLRTNLKIPPDRDRFCADLRRVQQILVSLIDNAIKFTPMDGKVTVRVWVETNTVVFQVEDTGIGISSSQQPHLFEKFQQLDTSYRRTYDGAGLGLALAQQCVTLHQGWIDVSSVEGQGSIFTVQLPNQAAFVPQATPSATLLSGGRIVLIEGNEGDATFLCNILTAANYQLIWMVEASAAIDQIRLLRPSAVIVDAQLPGQGCLNLIRQLRSLPGTDKMKIIVLAPEGVSKDHQRYLSLGADAYLLKSLKPEDLLRKVEVLLQSAPVV